MQEHNLTPPHEIQDGPRLTNPLQSLQDDSMGSPSGTILVEMQTGNQPHDECSGHASNEYEWICVSLLCLESFCCEIADVRASTFVSFTISHLLGFLNIIEGNQTCLPLRITLSQPNRTLHQKLIDLRMEPLEVDKNSDIDPSEQRKLPLQTFIQLIICLRLGRDNFCIADYDNKGELLSFLTETILESSLVMSEITPEIFMLTSSENSNIKKNSFPMESLLRFISPQLTILGTLEVLLKVQVNNYVDTISLGCLQRSQRLIEIGTIHKSEVAVMRSCESLHQICLVARLPSVESLKSFVKVLYDERLTKVLGSRFSSFKLVDIFGCDSNGDFKKDWNEVISQIEKFSGTDCQSKDHFIDNIESYGLGRTDCPGCVSFFYKDMAFINSGSAQLIPIQAIDSVYRCQKQSIHQAVMEMIGEGGGVILFDCSSQNGAICPSGTLVAQPSKEMLTSKILQSIDRGVKDDTRYTFSVSFVPVKFSPTKYVNVFTDTESSIYPSGVKLPARRLIPFIQGRYVTRLKVVVQTSKEQTEENEMLNTSVNMFNHTCSMPEQGSPVSLVYMKEGSGSKSLEMIIQDSNMVHQIKNYLSINLVRAHIKEKQQPIIQSRSQRTVTIKHNFRNSQLQSLLRMNRSLEISASIPLRCSRRIHSQ